MCEAREKRAHRERRFGFALWRGVGMGGMGSRVCRVESTVAESVAGQSALSSALAARAVWMRSSAGRTEPDRDGASRDRSDRGPGPSCGSALSSIHTLEAMRVVGKVLC